jgi:hypothetical protein
MSTLEKAIALLGLVYSAIYLPVFVFFSEGRMGVFIPLHVLAMVSVIIVAALAFKDLYQRPFSTTSAKLKWLAFMLLFGPVIIVYLFKHAFKPRLHAQPG